MPLPPEPLAAIPTRRPTHELVAHNIRQAIMTGQLQPGERLNQDDIAKSLGVSRIPAREALLKLQAEGLVVSTPHKGFSVVDLSLDEINDLYSIRIVLESMAIRLAIPNMTPARLERLREILKEAGTLADDDYVSRRELSREFHTAICDAANRPRLLALIANLRNIVESYSPIYTMRSGRPDVVLREHRQIYEACRRGDAKLAEKLMQEHLQSTLDYLLAQLKASVKPSDGQVP